MALGKSLGNILGDYFGDEAVSLDAKSNKDDQNVQSKFIPIDQIDTSPYQTRTEFSSQKINSLAQNIKKNGLIHPILVLERSDTTAEKKYQLLAGERRLRATQSLGETKIHALIKQESDLTKPEQAMITAMENLQREDLSPIELAKTFQMLMDTQNIDEPALASMLDSSGQYIKNYLRLLDLSVPVQNALQKRQIGEGQARYLVGLSDEDQLIFLREIIEKDLTVKEVIMLIKKSAFKAIKPAASKIHQLPDEIVTKAQKLAEFFPKSKLAVKGDDKKGKITISWG